MSIFVTADHHFFHKNIRNLANRPFESDEDMRETLINNFNERVTNQDQVYILGDFLWRDCEINNIMPRLNGKYKCLVAGNHDGAHTMHKKHDKMKELMLLGGFDEVCDEKMLVVDTQLGSTVKKVLVKLNHFPYKPKEGMDLPIYELRYLDQRPNKGSENILVHGHTHSTPFNRVQREPFPRFDCGVDGNSYYPYKIEEIFELLRQENLL